MHDLRFFLRAKKLPTRTRVPPISPVCATAFLSWHVRGPLATRRGGATTAVRLSTYHLPRCRSTVSSHTALPDKRKAENHLNKCCGRATSKRAEVDASVFGRTRPRWSCITAATGGPGVGGWTELHENRLLGGATEKLVSLGDMRVRCYLYSVVLLGAMTGLVGTTAVYHQVPGMYCVLCCVLCAVSCELCAGFCALRAVYC